MIETGEVILLPHSLKIPRNFLKLESEDVRIPSTGGYAALSERASPSDHSPSTTDFKKTVCTK